MTKPTSSEARLATLVRVAPLRDEFVRQVNIGQVTAADVAKRMGWPRSDTSRVQRTLGLRLRHEANGYPPHYAEWVERRTARALAKALHLDPREVGL